MKIVNNLDGFTIYKNDKAENMKELVEMAVAGKVSLKHASLRGVDLSGADLTGADLSWADLTGADLSWADLSWADLTDANLTSAILISAVLSGVDFTGASIKNVLSIGVVLENTKFDFEIPVIPDIHKKVYEAASRKGALNMDKWHTCETTHCIAGWVIVLAGEQAKRLEKQVVTELVAKLIYLKSDPKKRMPNFYTTNENAMRELKELAESS